MSRNISCCFSQRFSQLSNNLGLCHKAVWFFSEDCIFLIASNWFQFHKPAQSSLETVPAFSTYNMMQQQMSFIWSEELIFSLSSAWCLLVLVSVSASENTWWSFMFLFQSISFDQKSFVAVYFCSDLPDWEYPFRKIVIFSPVSKIPTLSQCFFIRQNIHHKYTQGVDI